MSVSLEQRWAAAFPSFRLLNANKIYQALIDIQRHDDQWSDNT